MKNNPLISVVIPTYNRKKLLPRAIKSALTQSYKNIEVWIIDDGSSDGTESVVKSLQNDCIHYFRLENNAGPSAARNEGIRRSYGDIIAFLDSDDVWRKDKLEKQLKKMNEGYQAVFCKYIVHDQRKTVMPLENYFDVEGTENGFLDILLDQNKIGAPTLMLSREAIESIGGFCEDFHTLEDWEYVLRLADKNEIGFLPEILVDVYLSAGSVGSRRGSKRADVLLSILDQYWGKYKNKEVFDNIIRYLYDDFETESKVNKQQLKDKFFSITGYNSNQDYFYRQSASIWRQINLLNNHLLEIDNIVLKHNKEINKLNSKLGEHNEAIIELNDKLGEHNDAIISLNDKLGEHNEAIIELNDRLGEHNDAIISLNDKLGEHNDGIIKLNTVVAEHNNAINRIDATIADIIKIVNDRTMRIEMLEKGKDKKEKGSK